MLGNATIKPTHAYIPRASIFRGKSNSGSDNASKIVLS